MMPVQKEMGGKDCGLMPMPPVLLLDPSGTITNVGSSHHLLKAEDNGHLFSNNDYTIIPTCYND